MENKRFEHIITRYLKGKATPEEEAELLQAIHASKEWEAAFRKRTAEWNPLEETEGSPDKPGGLSIQLCKSEKKEFYIRYSS